MAPSILKFIVAVLAVGVAIWSKKIYDGRNPSSEAFVNRVTYGVSTNMVIRMIQSVALQALNQSPTCDKSNDSLKNQVVLLTGANRGIGFETARGLYQRGADLIMTCRKIKECEASKEKILADGLHAGSIATIALDLSDLNSISTFSSDLTARLQEKNLKLDQVIFNAAVWPNYHSLSPQGHELAFATNTLAPFSVFQLLHKNELLKENAKVITVTGDIYIVVKGTKHEGCSSDFTFSDTNAGMITYSRSKLGLMWIHNELNRRFPQYHFNVVHPGVMDNELTGTEAGKLPAFLQLNNEEGAQTTLIVATSPSVEKGAYYHNVLGKMILSNGDPALNQEAAELLWDTLTQLFDNHFKTI